MDGHRASAARWCHSRRSTKAVASLPKSSASSLRYRCRWAGVENTDSIPQNKEECMYAELCAGFFSQGYLQHVNMNDDEEECDTIGRQTHLWTGGRAFAERVVPYVIWTGSTA
mmetsp:Transcript_158/g.314  ORF Transcript_158/g.314 Transcript_158/m.314 type:complete len:113 (-) Transcript_158:156-494(-)